MNIWVKVGIGAAILGGVGFALYKGAKKVIDGISYKITKFGLPVVSGSNITIPITIRIINDSIVPIPVDQIQVDLSYKQNDQYIASGHLVQAGFTVNPGTQDITIYPVIDVKLLFQNFLQTLKSSILAHALSIKTDVMITIKGVTASDTVYNDVPVDLKTAVGIFK